MNAIILQGLSFEEKKAMRIIFVRHGEPDYQKDCLTDEGRVQAAAAAEHAFFLIS